MAATTPTIIHGPPIGCVAACGTQTKRGALVHGSILRRDADTWPITRTLAFAAASFVVAEGVAVLRAKYHSVGAGVNCNVLHHSTHASTTLDFNSSTSALGSPGLKNKTEKRIAVPAKQISGAWGSAAAAIL